MSSQHTPLLRSHQLQCNDFFSEDCTRKVHQRAAVGGLQRFEITMEESDTVKHFTLGVRD